MFGGSTLEMKDIQLININLLHFLNIKQQFSFMNSFLCLPHVSLGQHWEKWNKKMSKTRGCVAYISDCL